MEYIYTDCLSGFAVRYIRDISDYMFMLQTKHLFFMSVGWNVELRSPKFQKFKSTNNLSTGTDRPRYLSRPSGYHPPQKPVIRLIMLRAHLTV